MIAIRSMIAISLMVLLTHNPVWAGENTPEEVYAQWTAAMATTDLVGIKKIIQQVKYDQIPPAEAQKQLEEKLNGLVSLIEDTEFALEDTNLVSVIERTQAHLAQGGKIDFTNVEESTKFLDEGGYFHDNRFLVYSPESKLRFDFLCRKYTGNDEQTYRGTDCKIYFIDSDNF